MCQLQVEEAKLEKATQAISIVVHLLLAVVYRTIPIEEVNAHPLQCREECVLSAQSGLLELVNVGEGMISAGNPRGWRLLVNV